MRKQVAEAQAVSVNSEVQPKRRGDFISFAEALAAASSSGVPTREITAATFATDGSLPKRAELLKLLESLIATDPIWSQLIFDPGKDPISLAPNAFVHWSDGVLPDEDQVIPILIGKGEPAQLALRDALIEPLLERLACLADIDASAILRVVIRPGHSTWLRLGASLHFAKFRANGAFSSSGIRLRPGGGLQTVVPSLAEPFMEDLARLWPFSFEAVFLDFENSVRLVDIFIDERSEQENSLRLAKIVSTCVEPFPNFGSLLANVAVHVPSEQRPIQAPISRGQSQGDRCVSGPMATSLDEATRFASNGHRPVLLTNSLMPSMAAGLERCGGLVLSREGPASHIAVLARSLGLAVVTRVDALNVDHEAGVLLGSEQLSVGEIISVREEDGGVYRGAVPTSSSPVAPIAEWLNDQGSNPVVVSIGIASPNLPTRLVGLCRSEMQVLGSSVAPVFKSYLRRSALTNRLEQIPEEIKGHLQTCLKDLLASSFGRITNYRLIDADLGEILDSPYLTSRTQFGEEGGTQDALGTVRGPRWALANGFYDWQIGMAISTAAAATRDGPIDLIVTLPSAFGVEEVRAVRTLFDRHLLEYPEARPSVRFGVMLETPRLCSAPSQLISLADAFSFGLNDLTSAGYGLTREAWAALGPYYEASGLEERDPFGNLDVVGVGTVVAHAIRRLRQGGAEGPIFLCGEPAASSAAHRQFAGELNLHFSVAESDWSRATVSCGRVIARKSGSVGLDHSPVSMQSSAALRRMIAAKTSGHDYLAQAAALRWLGTICPPQPFPDSQNWKVLKKLLVVSLFGPLEGKFFAAPWDIDEVVRYANTLNFPDRATRVSAFPSAISCHARSEIINNDWSRAELLEFLGSFDRNATLNVFPQQHIDQMCFRVVFEETGLFVEAGWGQAMYAFESQRGLHPIVSCQAKDASGLTISVCSSGDRLQSALNIFVESQRRWLRAIHDALPSILGVKQLAIEGYFDPIVESLAVVDIDLPFDLAWNTSTNTSR